MAEDAAALRLVEGESSIGSAPDGPEVPPEPVAPDERRKASATPSTRSRTTRSKSKRRSPRSRVNRILGRPSEPGETAGEPNEDKEPLTEQEVVRAFWWGYKAWCKFLGAPLEAERGDFQDLGEAWVGLGRKVPGEKLLMAAIAPLVATFGFLDLLQTALDKRTRRRQRKEGEEQPEPPSPAVAYPPPAGASGNQG